MCPQPKLRAAICAGEHPTPEHAGPGPGAGGGGTGVGGVGPGGVGVGGVGPGGVGPPAHAAVVCGTKKEKGRGAAAV